MSGEILNHIRILLQTTLAIEAELKLFRREQTAARAISISSLSAAVHYFRNRPSNFCIERAERQKSGRCTSELFSPYVFIAVVKSNDAHPLIRPTLIEAYIPLPRGRGKKAGELDESAMRTKTDVIRTGEPIVNTCVVYIDEFQFACSGRSILPGTLLRFSQIASRRRAMIEDHSTWL